MHTYIYNIPGRLSGAYIHTYRQRERERARERESQRERERETARERDRERQRERGYMRLKVPLESNLLLKLFLCGRVCVSVEVLHLRHIHQLDLRSADRSTNCPNRRRVSKRFSLVSCRHRTNVAADTSTDCPNRCHSSAYESIREHT
jgi:hypothetical protein